MNGVLAQTTYLRDYKIADYLIDTIDLEFNLDEAHTLVKSTLKIRRNPQTPTTNPLVLNGTALELVAIMLDGVLLTEKNYVINPNTLTIDYVPDACTLIITTRIKPQENTALSGLYKSSGNFCTQCEAEGFRRITYFLDRPDVMARYTTTIIADQERYPVLLSNGNLIEQSTLPDGKHKVVWEDPFKKPCYLFALVAGDFDHIEDYFVTHKQRRVTIKIFVEKGEKDKAYHAMEAVKKAMRWDEEHYGREYDLDIYMIVAVSDFNMGAMENKGLNIFNTQYILAKPETATDLDYVHVEAVIGHEYFHNWTGNRITCRDWFQLSLKEGLTVFREQCFTGDITSPTVARINGVNDLRNSQFIEDAGPLAHPVRPDSYVEINNFYTATVYSKGAEVIRMQRTLLGDALFRKGMDLYFTRHDGQAVRIEDFVKCMEDASHMDLSQFRLWYSQAGTPVLEVTDDYDPQKQCYTLKIKQICPATPGQPDKKPFHIPVKMGLMDAHGRELLSDMLQVKKSEETYHFNQLSAKPIPSLLREFSAPVKLTYDYSDHELLMLFQHDQDAFNRWEAGQKYAVNLILRLMKDKSGPIPQDYFAALRHQIQTMQNDKLLLAEMLMLPSEKYISEQMQVVDVDAIHEVREYVAMQIAQQLKADFIQQYEQNSELFKSYHYDVPSMAKRQWVARCLAYLSLIDDAQLFKNIIVRHFEDALHHNMTDTMAALHCIVNANREYREHALQSFYDLWKHDALVIDKWLNLQATSKLTDTLDKVKQLIHHPAFDIKNPNKVYSLIGGFGYRNPVRFHVANGEGYQFLRAIVLQLDALNPQIAARMVTPLSQWRRFDKNRQQLMRSQLEAIAQNKHISKDVGELVNKSLQN